MGKVAASQDPFRAIADPARRAMLDAMLENEQTVGALTGMLAMSQPAVSQHMKVLCLAGLVRERREGRRVLYRLEPGEMRRVSDWLAKYQVFWTERLDALDAHLASRKK